MPTPIEALPPSAHWTAIQHWRKRVREELIQRRTALPAAIRRTLGKRACARMVEAVDFRAFKVLGICWPIRGEFDVRDIAKQQGTRRSDCLACRRH
jgi:5-formyltetrahydrofolate cyclo-ligase